MKKVLIFGQGQMGLAVGFFLEKMGIEIAFVDKVRTHQGNTFFSVSMPDPRRSLGVIKEFKPDVVVVATPYFLNVEIAVACDSAQVPYIDLGGSVEISRKIHRACRNIPLMTDMGLAPGLINMWAEELVADMTENGRQVDSVEMYVGGLPRQKTDHILNYSCTWSIDGLINQYNSEYRALEGGHIVHKENREVKTLNNEYEYFPTSGGAAHSLKTMQDRGVKNCSYNTLRYHGHYKNLKCLERNKVLREYLENLPVSNDKVVMRCVVESGDVSLVKDNEYYGVVHLSAMQTVTSLPVAYTAKLFATKELENKSYTYEDLYKLEPNFNSEIESFL
jgi:saccharopine dehydrogenase-like NADP-dependent oxidoreductase